MPSVPPLALIALAFAVVTAGCVGVVGPGGDASATPTTTLAGTDSGPRNGTVVRVIAVVDGDTLDVRLPNGSTDRVRLLGVDTPEVHVEPTPAEFEGVPDTAAGRRCLRDVGENASAFARHRLDGRRVRLVGDALADDRGSYGRRLAYVSVDGQNFDYRLVAEGYARVYDAPFERSARFYAAESRAQSAGRGVWACRTVGQ
ncbi:MAG: thermonuclease family protein [Haloarculaceae archaeon]